jgi:hypothetical protein
VNIRAKIREGFRGNKCFRNFLSIISKLFTRKSKDEYTRIEMFRKDKRMRVKDGAHNICRVAATIEDF